MFIKCSSAGVAVMALCAIPAAASAPVRTVALTGQQAAGAPEGQTYSGFYLPSLNAPGHAAFTGFVVGSGVNQFNNECIWSEGSGELNMVAREFDEAPGVEPGVRFNSLSSIDLIPHLNSLGETAFRALLTGAGTDSTNHAGIWIENGDGLEILVRQSDIAPGVGAPLPFLSVGNLAFNDAGHALFTGSVAEFALPPVITEGIWSDRLGTLALVARREDPTEVLPGVNFQTIGPAVMNSAGHIAYQASLSAQGIDNTNDTAMFLDVDGVVTLVTREGQNVPGLSGVRFGQIEREAALNNAGHLAFRTSLKGSGIDTSNDKAMWILRDGTLKLVVRAGDAAPETSPGTRFDSFNDAFALNESGTLAFGAVLSGPDVTSENDFGIWTASDGELKLIARKGNAAPGAGPGIQFLAFHVGFFNAPGQLAFQAVLSGPAVVTGVNDFGIWAQNEKGDLQLVATTGDTLEVAPGDLRKIQFVQMAESVGLQSGGPLAFNDAGQLAFRAIFADASQGIFVTVGPDQDKDRVNDNFDNCPVDANDDQADEDGDGIGDACDNCIAVANKDQVDANNDGLGDACEAAPDINQELPEVETLGENPPGSELAVEACGTCGPGAASLSAAALMMIAIQTRRRGRGMRAK